MRVGAGFFTCQQIPGAERPQADLYADLRRHVVTAEKVGLDSFWLAEHHLSPDGYMASPLVAAASLAALTHRIEIGCEVACAFYHPLRLAEDAIAVDLISKGRFLLGLARSYREEEFAAYGLDPTEAVETDRLEAAVHVLRQAFAGREVSYRSAAVTIPPVILTPRPHSPEPRLVLGFHGDPLTEAKRAGLLNAIYRTDPSWPFERVLELIAAYDRAGGDPGKEAIVFCYGFVASSEDPWSVIAPGFTHLRGTYDAWRGGLPAAPDPGKVRLVLGDVDGVVDQVREYSKRIGDRVHLVLRVGYPGMAPERVEDALVELGQVAERLRLP